MRGYRVIFPNSSTFKGSQEGRNQEDGEATKIGGATTHPPNAKERPLGPGKLPRGGERCGGRRASRPAPTGWERKACKARGQLEARKKARGGERVGRGDKGTAESGRAPLGSGATAGQRRQCSRLTHLPDVRPAARTTDAAWALPLLRDTAAAAAAAAGAPGPESIGWCRSRQNGDRTRAQRGVHRGRRGSGKATCFTFLTSNQQRFPGTASCRPRPAAPGPSPAAPPQQRPGFRRPHSAPSLLALRHLVGGGKNVARMRAQIAGAPLPRKEGLKCAGALSLHSNRGFFAVRYHARLLLGKPNVSLPDLLPFLNRAAAGLVKPVCTLTVKLFCKHLGSAYNVMGPRLGAECRLINLALA